MKPKNQKQFNWSYFRFYLMWLLTTMLALIPLAVLFSSIVKCDGCKSKTSSENIKGVEKVNYEEVAIGLDSLITIVKAIDINNQSRDLKRTLDVLDNFRDDFLIDKNKKLSSKLKMLAGEIYGLTEQYDESTIKNERSCEQSLKSKDDKIASLDRQVTILQSQLNNQLNRQKN